MGDYNKGKGKGGGRFRGRDDRDGDRPAMHEAICNDCGKNCEVPFRPTGERPIYCSDCFKNQNDSPRGGRDRDYQRRDSRPRHEDRRQNQFAKAPSTENLGRHLEQINQTLNKILQVLSLATNNGTQMNESKKNEGKRNESSKSDHSKTTQKKKVDAEAVNRLVAEAIDSQTINRETKKATTKKNNEEKESNQKINL